MEMAQFGDTETETSKLKDRWLTLAVKDKGKRLEEEYARLENIVDDKKALSVGEFKISF